MVFCPSCVPVTAACTENVFILLFIYQPLFSLLLSRSSPGSAAFTCWRTEEEKREKEMKEEKQQHGALVRRRWKMSERRRKQTGRRFSVFLSEVIMCSPRCFCSHANEVDRVGNHFQTLHRGGGGKKTKKETKVEKAKQKQEQREAPLPPVCRSGGGAQVVLLCGAFTTPTQPMAAPRDGGVKGRFDSHNKSLLV